MTVENSIKLYDGMSPVFHDIMKKMIDMEKGMENLGKSTESIFNEIRNDIIKPIKPPEVPPISAPELPPIKPPEVPINKFIELRDKIMAAASSVYLLKAAFEKVQQVMNLSDNLSSITTRLNMMNDGLQTTAELQNMIMKSAENSRASYLDVANSVAKIGNLTGDLFKTNKELIKFSETLNKSFVVGGTSAEEQRSAMLQLTQAMASGALQGDELRSIKEAAPMIIEQIAKYMGVGKGALKELGAEGKITADIIKKAVLNGSEEINNKFNQMPVTFAQAMNLMGNRSIKAFEDVLNKLSSLVNNQEFNTFLDKFTTVITAAGNLLYWLLNTSMTVFNGISGFLSYITDDFNTFNLAIMGVASAVLYWTKIQAVLNGAIAVFNGLLISNPIGMTIAAIGLLITYLSHLYNTNEQFAMSFIDTWERIKFGIASVFNDLKRLWNFMVDTVQKFAPDTLLQKVEVKDPAKMEAEFRQNVITKMEAWKKMGEVPKDNTPVFKSETPKIQDVNVTGGTLDGIKGSIKMDEESAKLLTDVAREEFINRFTTLQPSVTANFGDVHETADVGGIMKVIEKAIINAMDGDLNA